MCGKNPLQGSQRSPINYVRYYDMLLLGYYHITLFRVNSDSNGIQTHNHLVRKRTLNGLAKLPNLAASLAKWLSVRLRPKSL